MPSYRDGSAESPFGRNGSAHAVGRHQQLSANLTFFGLTRFKLTRDWRAACAPPIITYEDQHLSEKEDHNVESYHSCKGRRNRWVHPGHCTGHWHGHQFHMGQVGPTVRAEFHSFVDRGQMAICSELRHGEQRLFSSRNAVSREWRPALLRRPHMPSFCERGLALRSVTRNPSASNCISLAFPR